jgi:uncharacterized RDD family membrane protein YckC
MEGIKILTTQNVDLEYTPASVGDRMGAAVIDDLIRLAWILTFIKITDQPGTVNMMVFVMLPLSLYPLLCEIYFNGQSIGKRALKIKVLMLDGSAPTLSAYLLRWLFRLLDTTVAYGIVALITAGINGKGQRLGDIVAGTAVVKITPPLALRHILPDEPEPNYSIQFPEVSLLNDKNISIIRTILRKSTEESNAKLIKYTALRVKRILNVESTANDLVFLQIIVKDYTQFAYQEYANS